MLVLAATVSASEPLLLSTNTYPLLIERFCRIYNTGDAVALFNELEMTVASEPDADRFRLRSFAKLYTNVSDVQIMPVGWNTNAESIWIQIGKHTLELPTYPVQCSCKFNGATDGFMQFSFPLYRGAPASNACVVVMGLTNPTHKERTDVMNIIIESDMMSQPAGGAYVAPAAGAPSAHP